MPDGAKKRVTGFGGLVTLVSEVQTVIHDAKQASAGGRASKSASERTGGTRSAAPSETPVQLQPVRHTTFRWGRAALAGAALALVAIAIDEAEDSPSTEVASPTAPVSPSSPALGAASAANPPIEQRPAAGGNERILTSAEIRYCLAEEIRIRAAEAVVNNYNDKDVDRFNVYIDDYNQRCGRFRYRSGAVERARADIEAQRFRLEAEGRARFKSGTSSRPAAMPHQVSRFKDDIDIHGGQRSTSRETGTGMQPSVSAIRAASSRDKKTGAGYTIKRSARERENLATCISGEYSTLCDYSLLTAAQQGEVAAAERRVNYRTCISGEYPTLCKHQLLNPSELVKVSLAERRANYRTCSSGEYPALCNHEALTADQAVLVKKAERRVNYRTCASGEYSALCRYDLLSPSELQVVRTAELQENYRICVSGVYTMLCKRDLLTAEQLRHVTKAESRLPRE